MLNTINIIAFRISAGYMYNFDDFIILDDIYKFHIGGQTTLRGWNEAAEAKLVTLSLIVSIPLSSEALSNRVAHFKLLAINFANVVFPQPAGP